MARALLVLLFVTLGLWALVDVAQTPAALVQRLSKPVWLLVVLVPLAGPIGWFLEGRRPATASTAGRPIAPDDDPDFLRGLRDQKRPDSTP